jgi:hypothetical protein
MFSYSYRCVLNIVFSKDKQNRRTIKSAGNHKVGENYLLSCIRNFFDIWTIRNC